MLALDTLRAVGAEQSIAPLVSSVNRMFESLHDPQLLELARIAASVLNHAESWLGQAQGTELEAGSR